MNDEKIQHLMTLRLTLERRLRVLEVQAAQFGPRTSPETVIEIENLRTKIAEVNTQLSHKQDLKEIDITPTSTRDATCRNKIIGAVRIAIIPLLLAIVLTWYIFTPLQTDITSTSKVSGVALEQPGTSGYSEEDDWFTSFMMAIEPDGWSLGEHQYSITVDCPQPYGKRISQVKFKVSNDAELKPSALYLRPKGIFDERFVVGSKIDVIHPRQKTVVSVALTRLTELEARRRSKDCKVTVEWDNGPSIPVSPLDPNGQPGGSGGGDG